jgi:ribosomal protein L21
LDRALVGRRPNDELGVTAADDGDPDDVDAEPSEAREVHFAEVIPLTGEARIVIAAPTALAGIVVIAAVVVVHRQRDLAVLNDVDDHAPRRCVGHRRDQDLLADLEERGRHPFFIGSIRHDRYPDGGSLDGFRRTSDG